MRKSELGAWRGCVGIAAALVLLACSEAATPVAPARVDGVPVGSAPAAPASSEGSSGPAAAERRLPAVAVASSLCEGLSVEASSTLRSGASAEMLLAERRSCAGAVGEAVRHWRAAALAEPRLGDIMNRRIAQATGGGRLCRLQRWRNTHELPLPRPHTHEHRRISRVNFSKVFSCSFRLRHQLFNAVTPSALESCLWTDCLPLIPIPRGMVRGRPNGSPFVYAAGALATGLPPPPPHPHPISSRSSSYQSKITACAPPTPVHYDL